MMTKQRYFFFLLWFISSSLCFFSSFIDENLETNIKISLLLPLSLVALLRLPRSLSFIKSMGTMSFWFEIDFPIPMASSVVALNCSVFSYSFHFLLFLLSLYETNWAIKTQSNYQFITSTRWNRERFDSIRFNCFANIIKFSALSTVNSSLSVGFSSFAAIKPQSSRGSIFLLQLLNCY